MRTTGTLRFHGAARLGVALAAALASLLGAGCTRYLVAPKVDIARCSPMAVADFQSRAAWDADLGQKLADAVLADVFQNRNAYRDEAARNQVDVSATPPALEFVERAQLAQVVREQDFGATERVDVSTAPKIGAISGARAVLFGTVEEFSLTTGRDAATNFHDATRGTQYTVERRAFLRVSYKIVDAATARILYAGAATGDAEASADYYPEAGEKPTLESREELKARAIAEVAERVGEDLYYHFTY
jgi:hypothetical protein